MSGRHYHRELVRLREESREFALAWPALAPALAEPSADPDAERLLEGIAFKIGLLREKLEADFPEVVNEMMGRLFPHYARHLPASTVIAFTLQPPATDSRIIPAGTLIHSVPVKGTSCPFSTTRDVEAHPLRITGVTQGRLSAREWEIRLSLSLAGLPLRTWRARKINLYLSGDRVSAADLFLCLNRHLKAIVIAPETGGTSFLLPPERLRPVGFDADASLFPYPPHAFSGYRLLQEYFAFSDKFLFFDLSGLEQWQDRGEGNRFCVTFQLEGPATGPIPVRRDSFTLSAVPAVNLFPHEADPILLDHRATASLLRPSGPDPSHYQIYSVDSVTGITRSTGRERDYAPFDLFRAENRDTPVYQTMPGKSAVHAGFDIYLSAAWPLESHPSGDETLSIQLACGNGTLPEGLHTGDVTRLSSPLTDTVSARNINPINPGTFPPPPPELGDRFTTHLFLSCLSLASIDILPSLLELYLFSGNRSGASVAANGKRIAGIREITAMPCHRWLRGMPLSGREVRVKARGDHFGGPGDLYLFGCVLERFLAQCAEPNTFTMLTLEETLKGGVYQWPPRLGRKPLL